MAKINTVVMDGQMNIQFFSGGDDRVAVSGIEINQVKDGYTPGLLEPINGSFYRARKNVKTGIVVRDLLSIATIEVLFSDFLDPHTYYKQLVFHKESMKIGLREWCTPGKSMLMESPTYSFGFPPPFDTDQDGLYDLIEWILGFDPEDEDSDDNGISDFEEIYGTLG